MSNHESDSNVFGFCPELQHLIGSRRTVGKTGKRFDGLPALSTRNNLITLRQLLLKLCPERTLEIGLSFGGSALVFTSSHRDLGRPPARQHVALDPFEETVWDSTGLLAIERAGLSGYLDFRPHTSALELPKMLADEERFGLIYVDGSHIFEDVFVDAYFSMRLLRANGVICFDDSTDAHVGKVLSFIRRSLPSAFSEIDLAKDWTEAGKSLKRRVARLLGRAQMTAFRRIGEPVREWNPPFVEF